MIDIGKQTSQFLDYYVDNYGHKKYRLKSLEQYSRERNTQEQVGKQYFSHKTLPDIIRNAPLAASRHTSSARQGQELEKGKLFYFISPHIRQRDIPFDRGE
jgi:dual specificity protein kinase YAK1